MGDGTRENPEACMKYKNVRRALTRRFPYQVFFIVSDSQVIIIAVFHGMRNPFVWQSRG